MNYANSNFMNLLRNLAKGDEDLQNRVDAFFETYEVSISVRQPVAEDLKEKKENGN